jgi:hypothetical protein
MRSQPFCVSFGAALLACAACGGGGSHGAPPAKLLDAVWCDIQAIPCVAIEDPANGLPTYCAVPGNTPLPASVPGGDRICFDSGSMSPQAACAQTCLSPHLSPVQFPDRYGGCSAAVDTDGTLHDGLNAQGFRPRACIGQSNNVPAYLSGAGTNTAAMSGSGTASFGGVTQPVVVHSGRFNFAAPDTTCSVYQDSCTVQVNQLDLAFDDLSVAGLQLQDFALFFEGPTLTASGTFQPGEAAEPDPGFIFLTPELMQFDAIGTIRFNGASLPAFTMTSDTEAFATLDLATGAIALQFSIESTLGGQSLELKGVTTTSATLDEAPVVTLPDATSFDEGTACFVTTTLTALASSPVGLPVALAYAIDDGLPALAGPTASAALYGVGAHQITIFASDTMGGATRVTQMATVTGSSPCQ